MSFSPDFLNLLDEEVRAFIHVSGIVFRTLPNGSMYPVIRVREKDWLVALYEGDPRTLDYWRETALRSWSYIGSEKK